MRPCLLDRAKGSCGGRGSLGRNAAASKWSSELLAFFQSLGETTTTTTTSSSQDKVRARSDAVLQRWRFGSDASAAIFFFFTSGRRFFRRTLFQGHPRSKNGGWSKCQIIGNAPPFFPAGRGQTGFVQSRGLRFLLQTHTI